MDIEDQALDFLDGNSVFQTRLLLAARSSELLAEVGFLNTQTDRENTSIAALCKITSSLIGGVTVLAKARNAYSLAAIARQLVEVEYLTYALRTGHRAAADWFSSTKQERANSWAPRHLYSLDGSPFSKEEYQDYCELGGHPTPKGVSLTEFGKEEVEEIFCEALIHVHNVLTNIHEFLAEKHPRRSSSEAAKWRRSSSDFKSFFENDPALVRLQKRRDFWAGKGKPR